MKIFSLFTVAVVAADEKKVPPKHPSQRLNTIGKFYTQFSTDVLATSPAGAAYAARFNTRMQSMVANMGNAFNRDNCGYYDDSTKHGGPDPNPETNANGKPRNRREGEDNDFEDDLWTEVILETTTEACANGPSGDVLGDCCDMGLLDATVCQKAPRKGKKGTKKTAWERLSNDPALKWKQITTGTRKWADRYINNCGGQRKNKHIKNRMKKVYGKVMIKAEL